MGRSSKDSHGAKGSRNLLDFEPERLVIVRDENHTLYDERIHMPLDEALVLNIMHHGVLEPVIVRRNSETSETEVVDGRQRVRATIEANQRLRAEGRPAILVPAVVRKGSDASQFGVMISTNEVRQQDNAMVRARKMRRAVEIGQTEAQIAVIFGVSPGTVKNMLGVLDASTPVRNAVESGRITATDAYKLSRLDAEEQKSKLDELLSSAPKAPGKRRSPKPRAEGESAKPEVVLALRPRAEIEAMRDKFDADDEPFAAMVLRWVLLEPGVALKSYETVPDLVVVPDAASDAAAAE